VGLFGCVGWGWGGGGGVFGGGALSFIFFPLFSSKFHPFSPLRDSVGKT